MLTEMCRRQQLPAVATIWMLVMSLAENYLHAHQILTQTIQGEFIKWYTVPRHPFPSSIPAPPPPPPRSPSFRFKRTNEHTGDCEVSVAPEASSQQQQQPPRHHHLVFVLAFLCAPFERLLPQRHIHVYRAVRDSQLNSGNIQQGCLFHHHPR